MYSARTKLACEIAGVDPLRLNEDHHHNVYECLPETVAGKARVFQVHDILALRIFGMLTRAGLSRSVAGEIACTIRYAAQFDHPDLRDEPKLEGVTAYIVPEELRNVYKTSIRYEYLPSEYFATQDMMESVADMTFGPVEKSCPIAFDINVKEIRQQIINRLEEEARILGND